MNERPLTCRFCGRPIVVPASTCPWCGRTIMVICSSCRQYTDDQEPVCQHCGAPLIPATLEKPPGAGVADERIAHLLADRERAQLVASGVVVQYFPGFFYTDARFRTVLVDLFGPSPDRLRQAAALLFAATAYLIHHGYCAFQPAPVEEAPPLWAEQRPWDGQRMSLEGMLARQAGLGLSFPGALQQALRTEAEKEIPPTRRFTRAATKGLPISEVVLELARRTVLPEHRESEACRETYRMLVAFVSEDPTRARRLAREILDVLTGLQGQ
ncbi:MAG: zinc ribbon domain-containing protein [Anaerolineae bacterium]|nr:zinc ribbon domain-containing protein [Anaerolineae bacterium]MCX8066502.1 zinc ribbon domain-containing protein [Anaerolineae bacterium]